MSSRKETIRLNIKRPWELALGHKQDRRDTTMDSRPKRQRTRSGVDKQWRRDYNME